MEAARNLHTFHEFPENAPLELRISALYGLELMVDRGTGCGPAAASSSERPMQAPESRPVHGTPSISGMSGLAPVVVNPSGEFGTRNGVQDVVKTSSSSPVLHAAMGVESIGCATIAAAGAIAIAIANPPASSSRRGVNGDVVILSCLPSSLTYFVSRNSTNADSDLSAFFAFAGNLSVAHTKKLGHGACPSFVPTAD